MIEFLENLFDTTGSIGQYFVNFIVGVYNFFVTIFDFFTSFFLLFPAPFNGIIIMFLVLLFGLLVLKLVRG